MAERDGQKTLIIPEELRAVHAEPAVKAILRGQQILLDARRATRAGRSAQLNEQIKQFGEQIEGLEAQRDAKAQEIGLVKKELEDLSALLEKGLVKRPRVTALKRDKARLEGEWGGFVSEIAQAKQAISEREIQILLVDEDMRAEVVDQLPKVRSEISELLEQKIATLEELRRLEIRAPRAGHVHQLAVHTVGGVVASGEDLMHIVPHEDVLVVEAHVAPTDVDQLAPAQEAIIRFPGLDQRTTPELSARILTVSADLVEDPSDGTMYYEARLALAEEEIAKLGDTRLVPGMPVEAFVQTRPRTILSFLLKPLSDHIARAFREG